VGEDSIVTTVVTLDLIKQHEEVTQKIKELKHGKFIVSVPSHPDVIIDNKIRDKVLELIAFANKHRVKSSIFENKFNDTYVLTFYKEKKNRT
jgi:hypothetical protein